METLEQCMKSAQSYQQRQHIDINEWRRPGVFVVMNEQISCIVLIFLLSTLEKLVVILQWLQYRPVILQSCSNYSFLLQKQPTRGVLKKRCSENMQQIYRRAPMPNDHRTSAWVFSCKFAAYFQNTFS